MALPLNQDPKLPAQVVMYKTPFCGYCVAASRFLAGKGVQVKEIDVSGDGDCRRWLFQVTGMRTVPQIFINGRPVKGYEDIVALDRQGRLDPLLREPPDATASAPVSPCQSLP
jgi:glutaredoxin 3